MMMTGESCDPEWEMRFFALAFCTLFVLTVPQALSAPPESDQRATSIDDDDFEGALEQSGDPYIPGARQIIGGPRTFTQAPPGSVQVNVDANGLNIPGDAANEPSLVIDPTNPLRMTIGWRQFD